MHYELWTVPSGNIIDDFDTEGAALVVVRHLLEGAPAGAADHLLLTVVTNDGSGRPIATGEELASRARSAPVPPTAPTD